MKKVISAVLIATLISTTGCAAMFHGTSDQVSIHSNDPAASLYVNGSYVGKGHAITTFKKRNDYVITARKEGCSEFSLPASKSFDGISLLGILIDAGLISVLVIDGAATGAWQSFDQTSYVVDPSCNLAAR